MREAAASPAAPRSPSARACASSAGSTSNQNLRSGCGCAALRTSTERGNIMPKGGATKLVMRLGGVYWPGAVSRAISTSRYCPQRAGTATSPMCSDGLTPPAMPLKTMCVTSNRSSASCVVMVALVMLTPERNSTTALPSSVPVVKRTPLTRCSRASCSRASNRASSGSNAETTAMRGWLSSRTAAGAGPAGAAAQPASASSVAASTPATNRRTAATVIWRWTWAANRPP